MTESQHWDTVHSTKGTDVSWWQPADDMKSFKAWGGTDRELYEKAAREHYEIACRLLRDGFMQLGVELQRKCDADHWHEVETAWLGGVDADPYDAQGKANVSTEAVQLSRGRSRSL